MTNAQLKHTVKEAVERLTARIDRKGEIVLTKDAIRKNENYLYNYIINNYSKKYELDTQGVEYVNYNFFRFLTKDDKNLDSIIFIVKNDKIDVFTIKDLKLNNSEYDKILEIENEHLL